MKLATYLVLWLGLTTVAGFADSPVAPFAYVTAAPGRTVYFKMVPRSSERSRHDDGFGIAYRVRADGPDEELWRTDGWYSFEVFPTPDGRYLVAMGPWNIGHEPRNEDLAVAFYAEGKLLKRYSTADLVKNRSKVLISVSHYRWLARDRLMFGDSKEDPDAELRVSWDNTFRLKTCDGIVYVFDMTTGNIKTKKP